MKKNAVVLFFLAIVIFAVTAAASAQTDLPKPVDPIKDPYGYASKQDYYLIIDNRLTLIEEALNKNELETANKLLEELRLIVYRCMRFLAANNSYDARMMNVYAYAAEAFEENADYPADLQRSRLLACAILLDNVCGGPTGGVYSPYYGGSETSGSGDESDHS